MQVPSEATQAFRDSVKACRSTTSIINRPTRGNAYPKVTCTHPHAETMTSEAHVRPTCMHKFRTFAIERVTPSSIPQLPALPRP